MTENTITQMMRKHRHTKVEAKEQKHGQTENERVIHKTHTYTGRETTTKKKKKKKKCIHTET